MPRLKPNELHTLYPRGKSGEEITAELRSRQAKRKPRFIALQIATCALIAYVSIVLFLQFFGSTLTNSLMSNGAGAVLSSVSVTMLAGLVGCAFLYYLYSTVRQLIAATLIPPGLMIVIGILLSVTGGILTGLLPKVLVGGIVFFGTLGIVKVSIVYAGSKS